MKNNIQTTKGVNYLGIHFKLSYSTPNCICRIMNHKNITKNINKKVKLWFNFYNNIKNIILLKYLPQRLCCNETYN